MKQATTFAVIGLALTAALPTFAQMPNQTSPPMRPPTGVMPMAPVMTTRQGRVISVAPLAFVSQGHRFMIRTTAQTKSIGSNWKPISRVIRTGDIVRIYGRYTGMMVNAFVIRNLSR
jgi:hypothetical protein